MGDRVDNIPYIVHEAALERQEKTIKRLWVLCIIMFVAFVLSNVAWLVYESQFEDVVTTISQENDNGDNNYIGNDGDINYGIADDNSTEESP